MYDNFVYMMIEIIIANILYCMYISKYSMYMQLVTYIHIAYISIHDKENMNFLLSVFIISKAMQKLFLIRRRRYLGENNFLRKHADLCMIY